MLRRLLSPPAFAAALLLVAVSASASELSLSWDRCFSDGNVYNKTFACDVNTGSDHIVGSYMLDSDLTQVSGNEIVLDFVSQGFATLPSWWQYHNAGTCRQQSLSVFPAPLVPLVHCVDLWNGQAAGGLAAYRTFTSSNPTSSPDRARAVLAFAVAPESYFTVPAGADVFSFDLRINHQRTVGIPSCAGCDVPLCITFASLNITRPVGLGDVRLPNGNTQRWKATVVWQSAQGGVTTVICNRFGQCEFESICAISTPVQNRTWGTLKSLYR